MKISAQEEYGLRCLLQLARADAQARYSFDLMVGIGFGPGYRGSLEVVNVRIGSFGERPEDERDRADYQTIYARHLGAVGPGPQARRA